MTTVYAYGTKKAVNEKIKNGEHVDFVNYSMFGAGGCFSFSELRAGTVVKFWSKRDMSGTPIARAYGQVKGGKIV